MNLNKKSISTILCSNILYESDNDIAEMFNSYFSEIGVALDKELSPVDENPLTYLPTNNSLSMFLKPIETGECSKIIRALKPTKQNKNTISTKCFVNHHHYFVNVVTEIINSCFQKGEFPKTLKKAIVTPIFKKGDPSILSNYRPISVLPLLSKTLEGYIPTYFELLRQNFSFQFLSVWLQEGQVNSRCYYRVN